MPKQELGKPHLRYVGISDRTYQSYRRACRNFFAYCHSVLGRLPGSLPELDATVAEYLNECWQEGEPHGYAGHLLSGLQRFHPPARHNLQTAWLYFNNWQSQVTPKRALPFPKEMLTALAAAAARVGQLRLSALLLVGFTCFLRTSELLSLKVGHVKLFESSGTVFVALEHTKTSGRKQAKESVYFRDRTTLEVLKAATRSLEQDELIGGFTHAAFSAALNSLLRCVGVEAWGFLPYSLRRGGASWHFSEGQNMDATVARGRWQSPKTAKIYIEDATAALVMLQLTDPVRARLEKLNGFWTAFKTSSAEPIA